MRRRTIHRHGPYWANHQLRKEEAAGQTQRDDGDVVNEEQRQQRQEGTGKTEDYHAEPRKSHIAGTAENPVRKDAAKAVADDAGEENARGEQRRVLDVHLVAILEEQRQPVQIQPQTPAVAKV